MKTSNLSENTELLFSNSELFLEDLKMLSLDSFKLSDQMIVYLVEQLKGYQHTRMTTTSAFSIFEMIL